MTIYFKPGGIKKYSAPYVVHIELTYISVKFGIANPYVDGSINSSGNTMVLPSYYLEVVLCGCVSSDATVVMYMAGFSYIFFIAHKLSTLKPVDGPTFVVHGFLILRGDQDVLMVLLCLKSVCVP